MVEILVYVDRRGRKPFEEWFLGLPANIAARINTAINRLSLGNFSNVKGVGEGVFEYKADFGPGYRIYFGKEGDALVVLLAGGTKRKQNSDIEMARKRWMEYRARKQKEKD